MEVLMLTVIFFQFCSCSKINFLDLYMCAMYCIVIVNKTIFKVFALIVWVYCPKGASTTLVIRFFCIYMVIEIIQVRDYGLCLRWSLKRYKNIQSMIVQRHYLVLSRFRFWAWTSTHYEIINLLSFSCIFYYIIQNKIECVTSLISARLNAH